MTINYYNCPNSEPFKRFSNQNQIPEFLSYEPNFGQIQEFVKKFESFKNLLIIGHGGSISTFLGWYSAQKHLAVKQVFFLSSVDPDLISAYQRQLDPKHTLVLAISKSGETVTQLEALLQFLNYPLVFITSPRTPLHEIAERLSAEVFLHPSIGGRYTGFTEVALLPAALCGLDIQGFFQSGRQMHTKFLESNEAWTAASILYLLEKQGFADVYLPIYSAFLFPFQLLIVQLCHESFGKAGKGGSYLAMEAPESQHHSNQRFFGGLKNIAGWFLGVENFSNHLVSRVPHALANILIKSEPLSMLNGIPLESAMQAEREGSITDAKQQGIPCLEMLIKDTQAGSLGAFVAFWQLFAIYSAVLRGVDPFNQPQVEASKVISFNQRLIFSNTLSSSKY